MHLLLFSFGLMYQCLNGAIPSWKCSIKAPAKWRNSVYVLCQRSKWLGPKCNLMWWLHNIETLRKIYKVYIWKLHIWWSRGVCHQTENSDEFLSNSNSERNKIYWNKFDHVIDVFMKIPTVDQIFKHFGEASGNIS